jgi:hypothetical protein
MLQHRESWTPTQSYDVMDTIIIVVLVVVVVVKYQITFFYGEYPLVI